MILAERDGWERGADGLAAGGETHALGVRGVGEAEQAGMVGALRASRVAAGAATGTGCHRLFPNPLNLHLAAPVLP